MGNSNWASLSNDIIFETIQGPGDFTREPNGANWVEQDLLVGKARMQKMGINLQQIDMVIRLHAFILPFSVLCGALEDAYINGDVLQFVYGTGEALGDFVITSMKYRDIQDSPVGLHIARDVNITLREYAGPGVAAQTGIDAAQAAFANKVPTMNTTPAIPSSTSQTYTNSLSNIEYFNRQIGGSAMLLQSDTMSLDSFIRDVNATLQLMQQAQALALRMAQGALNMPNQLGIISGLASVAEQTAAMIERMAQVPPHSTDPADSEAMVAYWESLDGSVTLLNVASQPMVGVVSWWPILPFYIP